MIPESWLITVGYEMRPCCTSTTTHQCVEISSWNGIREQRLSTEFVLQAIIMGELAKKLKCEICAGRRTATSLSLYDIAYDDSWNSSARQNLSKRVCNCDQWRSLDVLSVFIAFGCKPRSPCLDAGMRHYYHNGVQYVSSAAFRDFSSTFYWPYRNGKHDCAPILRWKAMRRENWATSPIRYMLRRYIVKAVLG